MDKIEFVSIGKNERYIFSTGLRNDLNQVSITSQSKNHLVSSVELNSFDQVIYKYQPKVNFTGTDIVTICFNNKPDEFNILYNSVTFCIEVISYLV